MAREELTAELVLVRGLLERFTRLHGADDVAGDASLRKDALKLVDAVRKLVEGMKKPAPLVQALFIDLKDTGALDILADVLVERLGEDDAIAVLQEISDRCLSANDLGTSLPGRA